VAILIFENYYWYNFSDKNMLEFLNALLAVEET